MKDSFTRIWWMAKTDKPCADNRRVLKAYSKSMKDLLEIQRYNSGTRPSEHRISKDGFLKKHKGAIPPNVVESETDGETLGALLAYSNTGTIAEMLQIEPRHGQPSSGGRSLALGVQAAVRCSPPPVTLAALGRLPLSSFISRMSEPSSVDIRNHLDPVYRTEAGRILATLIRLLGDFDLAEDAMHDAFNAALHRRPVEGLPANPRAWLISAGRFKAIDASYS